MPTTHPIRNANPFARPFGVDSISTTVMIGTGLSATPTPNGRACRSPGRSSNAALIRFHVVIVHGGVREPIPRFG